MVYLSDDDRVKLRDVLDRFGLQGAPAQVDSQRHSLRDCTLHQVGPHAYMCDHGLVMQYLPPAWPSLDESRQAGDTVSPMRNSMAYLQNRYGQPPART